MHLGKWTRRLIVAFVVWYVLTHPDTAGDTLRMSGAMVLGFVTLVFERGAAFLERVVR